MTPEALRRRMAHGNIYAADKVDAALANYFRVGNLAALRELALLWVADRVDEGLEEYRERHGITEPWETRERVVVALTGAPGGERLIRRGARAWPRAATPSWSASTCAAPTGSPARTTDLLDRHRVLLDELGGRYAEVTGLRRRRRPRAVRAGRERHPDRPRAPRAGPAGPSSPRARSINRVIAPVGADRRPRDLRRDAAERRRAVPSATAPSARRCDRPARSRTIAWLVAVVGIPLLVARAAALRGRDRAYPASCSCCCSARSRWRCSAGCARRSRRPASPSCSPTGSTSSRPTASAFAHAGDALALVVFVAVSSLVSGLVDRLARRSAQLRARPGRVGGAGRARHGHGRCSTTEALHRLVTELRVTLDLDAVAVLAPTADGWRVEASAGEAVPRSPEDGSYSAELAGGSMLVVAGPSLPAEDRRLLSAFVAQLRARAGDAAAAGRGDLGRRARRGQQRARRAARRRVARPARSARQHQGRGDEPAQRRRRLAGATRCSRSAKTIDAEADRLNALGHATCSTWVGSQAGMLGVQLSEVAVDEVVYAALASLAVDVSAVDVDVPDDLPLVSRRSRPARAGARERDPQRAQLGARGDAGAGRGGRRRRPRRRPGDRPGRRHPPRQARGGVPAVPAPRRRRPGGLRRRRARAGRHPGLRRRDGRARSPSTTRPGGGATVVDHVWRSRHEPRPGRRRRLRGS